MDEGYIISARNQFEYYKSLGEKTIAQLSDEHLTLKPSPESNSIATIVRHLHGNMLSRWTDFLSTDGEKSWRQRDSEFENDQISRNALLKMWEEGWACLFAALDVLKPSDLDHIIYIRNQGHTVLEAINRQLAHYPYHVGQMVFIGKMFINQNWQSLSIPKNKSSDYNSEKFSKEKNRSHFTDEFLKREKD